MLDHVETLRQETCEKPACCMQNMGQSVRNTLPYCSYFLRTTTTTTNLQHSNRPQIGAMRALAVVGILSPGLMDGKRRKKLVRCEDLSALYRQSGDDPNQVLEWHKTLAGVHMFNVLGFGQPKTTNHPQLYQKWAMGGTSGPTWRYILFYLYHMIFMSFSILWDDDPQVMAAARKGGGYLHPSLRATQLPGRGWALCLQPGAPLVPAGTVLVRSPPQLLWVAHESQSLEVAEPLAPGAVLGWCLKLGPACLFESYRVISHFVYFGVCIYIYIYIHMHNNYIYISNTLCS